MNARRVMTFARIVALSAIAAAVAVAATATGANAAVQLTKPQCIAKADASCATADAKVTKLGPLVPASRAVAIGTKVLAIDVWESKEDWERYSRRSHPVVGQVVEELRVQPTSRELRVEHLLRGSDHAHSRL